jgi:hypothetical protein
LTKKFAEKFIFTVTKKSTMRNVFCDDRAELLQAEQIYAERFSAQLGYNTATVALFVLRNEEKETQCRGGIIKPSCSWGEIRTRTWSSNFGETKN